MQKVISKTPAVPSPAFAICSVTQGAVQSCGDWRRDNKRGIMATVNQCNFVGCVLHKGNLVLAGSQAKPMTNFTVCVSGKNKEKEALFIRCVVFGQTADFFSKYAQDKDTVYVSGELEKRKYKNKDGVEKESYQLVVRELQLFPRSKVDGNRRDDEVNAGEYTEPNGNIQEDEMF